jgi:hypothetical protein
MEKLNFSTQKLMEKTKKREKQFYTKFSESRYDRGKDKNARWRLEKKIPLQMNQQFIFT